MKQKKFILREEPFGYTISSRRTLAHQLIAKDDLEKVIRGHGLKTRAFEYLPAKRTDYRSDVIYSPHRVYYEITLACNLRCKFCFNSSGTPRNKELTTKEIISSLESFRQENILDIRFTGGEPTLRPDWYEILQTAKKLGFIISLNTNASCFTPITIKKLIALDLEQITISVDGQKENHDKNRGHGSFERTLKSIQSLSKAGAHLRINTLLSRYSLNDLEFMIDLAARYAEEINFFPVRFMGRGAELEDKYSIKWDEFYQFSQKAQEIKEKYTNLRIYTFGQVTKKMSVNQAEHLSLGLKIGTTSGATTLNVTSDGRFFAGGYVPYFDKSWALGNVRTHNIYEVWQKNTKLEKMRDLSGKLKKSCAKCPEIGKRCPGPIFETELYRLKYPKSKNLYCIYGDGPSLLSKM